MTQQRGGRDAVPRPFLKWAGGKGQLLGELLSRVRAAGPFHGYHEPFLGGGALFFGMVREGLLPKRVRLSDVNPNLLDAWFAVRDDVEGLIDRLYALKERHDEAAFYAVRAQVPQVPIDRAARVIYLNKTCFNGLYRENSRGLFNVPFGRYTNPTICDTPNLRGVAKALAGVVVELAPFLAVEAQALPGDLVYLDPPYEPLSESSSFTAYARGGFGAAEQDALAALVHRLVAKDVRVILSNSWTPTNLARYGDLPHEAVMVGRSVNSKKEGRGAVAEILVTSWPWREGPPPPISG